MRGLILTTSTAIFQIYIRALSVTFVHLRSLKEISCVMRSTLNHCEFVSICYCLLRLLICIYKISIIEN